MVNLGMIITYYFMLNLHAFEQKYLKIVASIYNPRSVNAVGATVLNFSLLSRSKILTTSHFSYSSNSKTYYVRIMRV